MNCTLNKIRHIMLTAGCVALSVSAIAQGVKQVDAPYLVDRPLPFAPANQVRPPMQMPQVGAPGLMPRFDVRDSDKTVREVLERWAKSVGSVHKPEHWTIDRDLPIMGTADASVFGTDFQNAVRKLLESSEFTDRPVQPCFYSNRIIRVVPRSEICDKTKSTESMTQM